MVSIWMILAVVLYLGAIGYLGYRGFRGTHTATDYMLGGRKVHPYVMAMPPWFAILFMLTLMSAAMSTLSSQFHVMGTSLAVRLAESGEVFIKSGPVIWAFVDPLLIGLPLAALVTVLVSLLTPKFSRSHLDRCLK
jgi:hypothetical protein